VHLLAESPHLLLGLWVAGGALGLLLARAAERAAGRSREPAEMRHGFFPPPDDGPARFTESWTWTAPLRRADRTSGGAGGARVTGSGAGACPPALVQRPRHRGRGRHQHGVLTLHLDVERRTGTRS